MEATLPQAWCSPWIVPLIRPSLRYVNYRDRRGGLGAAARSSTSPCRPRSATALLPRRATASCSRTRVSVVVLLVDTQRHGRLDAPEAAAVARAVAAGGVPGEVLALDGLARRPARDWRGVHQPDVVARWRQTGRVRKPVPQVGHCEAQEAPLARTVQQDLRDRGQTSLASVIYGPLRACVRRNRKIVCKHVKCRQEGGQGRRRGLPAQTTLALAVRSGACIPSPRTVRHRERNQ